MTEVVSVRFVSRGKKYYFDPNGLTLAVGDRLVVETAKGLDLGECVEANFSVEDSAVVQPLRPVIRLATADDLRIEEENKKLEREAFRVGKEKIAQHELDMKLVAVECGFEGNKILFFFTSDGRVDFRELVKDLASVFHTRIELRQIGVRDETKMMGGLGICGRPYCCNQFLNDFEPVSTKMAKTQSMSLNPAKISGSCGRLMCCLRYEQEAYEDLVSKVPKNGAFVQTTDGYGNVVNSSILRQRVKVRMDGNDEQDVRVFSAEQVATVPGGRPKPGEPLPNVLKYVPPPAVDEPKKDDMWRAPSMFADSASTEKPEAEKAEHKPREGGGHNRNRNRHKKPQHNGDKPKADRPQGDKPKFDKPHGDKPKFDKPHSEKPKAAAPATAPKSDEGEKAGEAKSGEKKRGGRNRRYRPKPKGEGGAGSQKP